MGVPDQSRLTLAGYETADPVVLGRNFRAIERALNGLPIHRAQNLVVAHDDVTITATSPTAFGEVFTFIKKEPWTRLDFDLRLVCFTTAAVSVVTFLIDIGGTSYELGTRVLDQTNILILHSTRRFIEGIGVGTYNLQLQAAVESGGDSFDLDANCRVELTVTETV